MKLLNNKYLLLICRVILAGIFIFAGIEKIADPSAFAKAIYNYKIFPDFSINFLAVVIPWLEIIPGILLLFGTNVKENSAIISSLLVLFIILIVISIFRDLNIDCGCFGTASGSKVGWMKIGENVLLLLLGIYLVCFSKEEKTES